MKQWLKMLPAAQRQKDFGQCVFLTALFAVLCIDVLNQSAKFASVSVHDTFESLKVAFAKERLSYLSRFDLAAVV